MITSLIRVKRKIDSISLRERIVILIATVSILLYSSVSLLFMPKEANLSNIKAQIDQKVLEILASEKKTQELVIKAQQKVEAPHSLEQAYLNKESESFDRKLDDYSTSITSSKEMAGLLQEMLRLAEPVYIDKVENLPAEPISLNKSSPGDINDIIFYRQGFTFEVKGNFFEIVGFLKRIESLKHKLFWDKLEYKVDKYPEAKVTLTVYKLSKDKEWIGI